MKGKNVLLHTDNDLVVLQRPVPVPCAGYWAPASCPGNCGYEEDNIPQEYVITRAPAHGGTKCPGTQLSLGTFESFQGREVSCPANDPCAIPCVYTWTPTPCPTNCGYNGEDKYDILNVEVPADHGAPPCPPSTRLRPCTAKPPCPIDCDGDWTPSPCPKDCGYKEGTITQPYEVAIQPAHGGKACPPSKEIICPTQTPCAINCDSKWSPTSCPTNCEYKGGIVKDKLVVQISHLLGAVSHALHLKRIEIVLDKHLVR